MFVVSDAIMSVQLDDEAKSIADQMDRWYLDLKKSLVVKFSEVFSLPHPLSAPVQKQFDQIRSQYFDDAQEHLLQEKEKFVVRCSFSSRSSSRI